MKKTRINTALFRHGFTLINTVFYFCLFTLFSLCPLPARRSLGEGGCSLWLKNSVAKV